MTYKSIESEFKLTQEIYELLFNGIKNGLKDFYNQKEEKNWAFIDYPTSKITLPWIRLVCINNAFIKLIADNPLLGITYEIVSTGSYEYIILTLDKENMKITISSVDKAGDLPNESEYRSDLAIGNDRYDPQQTLFEVEFDEELPKSLILTYNGKNGPIPNFVNLGAITSEQNRWIYELDIVELISKKDLESQFISDSADTENGQTSTVKLRVNIQDEVDEQEIPLPLKGTKEGKAK